MHNGYKIIFKFKKNPLQIFQWNSLDVVIDQKISIKVPWTQTVEYNIEAGHHNIQMSFPYMGKNAGKAQKEFDIKDSAGCGVRLMTSGKTDKADAYTFPRLKMYSGTGITASGSVPSCDPAIGWVLTCNSMR